MKRLLSLLGILILSLSLTACAALAPILSVVDTAISDTTTALSLIDAAFQAYQTSHPVSAEDRQKYELLLATAYQDLRTGTRAVADVNDLSQGQYDQAFADFKTAYAALVSFLKEKGVTPGSAGLTGAGAGQDFPEPMVIGLKIRS